MNNQIMQCPSCGSILPAPSIGTFTSCTYCGACLQVGKGSSGLPLAKLAEIRQDTNFIAKEHTREHLHNLITKIDAEIERIETEITTLESSPQSILSEKLGNEMVSGYLGALGGGILVLVMRARMGEAGIGVAFFFGTIVWFILAFIDERVQKARRARKHRHATEAIAGPLTTMREALAHKRTELFEATAALQPFEEEPNVLAEKV